jgi:hypothetical protein
MGETQAPDTDVELETVEPVESAHSGQPAPVSDEQLVAISWSGPGRRGS